MPTLLITGANRGIGLELTRQYASADWEVIACCRKPKEASALAKLTGKITIKALDVAKPASIARLANTLKGRSIDLLLNNAGTIGRKLGFGKTDAKDFLDVIQVNTLAPLLMSEAFVGHVKHSKQKKIVSISSRVGSIGDGPSGGYYAYRCSKTALNMAMANAAVELKAKGVIVAVLHPGWVKTDMGGRQAPLKVADSAAGIIKLIDRLQPADSGSFFNVDGARLPW